MYNTVLRRISIFSKMLNAICNYSEATIYFISLVVSVYKYNRLILNVRYIYIRWNNEDRTFTVRVCMYTVYVYVPVYVCIYVYACVYICM